MERVTVVAEPPQAAVPSEHEIQDEAEPVMAADEAAKQPSPASEPQLAARSGTRPQAADAAPAAEQASRRVPLTQGQTTASALEGAGRFQVFIVDTGWHSVARKVLKENLALVRDLIREDPIYVLDREASVEALRRHRHLMGRDPIITVIDTQAPRHRAGHPHGFHLSLGLMRKDEEVLRALQGFSRFLSNHRDCADIDSVVRQKFRREGIAGAVSIILSGGESAADKALTAM